MDSSTDDARRTAPQGPFRVRKYVRPTGKKYEYDDARHDAPPASQVDFPAFAEEWGDGKYEVLDERGRKFRTITVDGVGPGEHAGGQEAAEAAASRAGIHPQARAKAASILEAERVVLDVARELNAQGRSDLAARLLRDHWRCGDAGAGDGLTISARGDAADALLDVLAAGLRARAAAGTPGPG